jgi:hypothetical protein
VIRTAGTATVEIVLNRVAETARLIESVDCDIPVEWIPKRNKTEMIEYLLTLVKFDSTYAEKFNLSRQ